MDDRGKNWSTRNLDSHGVEAIPLPGKSPSATDLHRLGHRDPRYHPTRPLGQLQALRHIKGYDS
jgi:hypothetical protein